MKRLSIFLMCLLLSVPHVYGGTPVDLESCRRAAREVNRFSEVVALNDLDRDARAELTETPYRLSMNAYGQASYQTDAPNPASMTDFPFVLHPSPKFQYHTGFLLRQVIYSGGSRNIRRELGKVEHSLSQVEVERDELKSDAMVDELFLSIILSQKKEDIIRQQLNTLNIKLSDARQAYEAGKSYRDAILALEAQATRLEAELAGNAAGTKSAVEMLSLLTGIPMDASTEFQVPQVRDSEPAVIDPALARLDLEARRIELDRQLARASAMPSLSAFGTVGYGCWPLNFFEHNPSAYGVVGLTLLIPITPWRDVRQNTSMLNNAARKVEIQRERIERGRQVALLKYDGEISMYEEMIAANKQTVKKCEELCEELEKLSGQGVATISDYMKALDQLACARLDGELYAILKLQQQLLRKNHISSL